MTELEEKILTEEEVVRLGEGEAGGEVNEGWIRLYRQSMASPVWQNCHLWQVWTYCMMRACHKPVRFYMDGKVLTLERGQFITGRKKVAHSCRITENMAYRLMHILQDMGNLDIISNSRYSIVTVCNYERYQGNGIPNRQGSRHVLDKSQTGPRQVLDTYKNEKNEKNDKKKRGGTKTARGGVAAAPPSLPEILEYMKSINCPHPERNAEKFEAHYNGNGWKQNKGKPIVDWKASARGWKLRQEDYEAENPRKAETGEERAKRIVREMKEGK
jgi:hypothetical protein